MRRLRDVRVSTASHSHSVVTRIVRPRTPKNDSLAYHETLCCALSVVDAAWKLWASMEGNHWTR